VFIKFGDTPKGFIFNFSEDETMERRNDGTLNPRIRSVGRWSETGGCGDSFNTWMLLVGEFRNFNGEVSSNDCVNAILLMVQKSGVKTS